MYFKWRKVFRIKITFYPTRRTVRYKKGILSKHLTGTGSQKKKEKPCTKLSNPVSKICMKLIYLKNSILFSLKIIGDTD